MNRDQQLRNILIAENECSVRNVLRVLQAGLGPEGVLDQDSREALAAIKRESFDTILLDLRYSEMPVGEMVLAIKQLRPTLVGRVLIITCDVSDPYLLEMIEKNCWTYAQPHRTVKELRVRVRSLLGRILAFARQPLRR